MSELGLNKVFDVDAKLFFNSVPVGSAYVCVDLTMYTIISSDHAHTEVNKTKKAHSLEYTGFQSDSSCRLT
jgi:hypothetical protein